MLFTEFVDKYLVNMKVKEVDTTPDECWVDGVRTYKIKLKSIAFSGTFKTRFRVGPACGEPDIEGVLQSLASDALCVEYTQDKWDFIKEYGYDENPAEGERIYHLCQEHSEKLRDWMGAVIFEEFINCEEC